MVNKQICLDEIKGMVGTCLDRILNEYHHTVDYQYGNDIDGLTKLIIDRFGKPFVAPFKVNGNLIGVNFYHSNSNEEPAGYDSKNHVLYISDDIPLDFDYIKQIVSHEFSHIVDKSNRTKPDFDSDVTINNYRSYDEKSFDAAKTISYLFRPTEIQARLSAYHNLLTTRPKLINCKVLELDSLISTNPRLYVLQTEVEDCLKIKSMYKAIKMLEKYAKNNQDMSVAPNGVDYWTVLMIIAASRREITMRRNGDDNISQENNKFTQQIDSNTFLMAKKRIIQLYRKRMNDMIHKAKKIKYDVMIQQKNGD